MTTVKMRKRRLTISKPQWGMLGLLLLLCVLPMIGGAIRLTQFATGAEITEENARFFASPLPVIVHIISSLTYIVIGAFQFVKSIRLWKPHWHRWMGRVLLPLGIASALSALWMTLFYDEPPLYSVWLFIFRLIFGTLMLMYLIIGGIAIYRRDYNAHGRWMMRAYAIGIGAGTQAFTLSLGMVLLGELSGFSNAMFMGLGWVINLVIAEWIIQRRTNKNRKRLVKSQFAS